MVSFLEANTHGSILTGAAGAILGRNLLIWMPHAAFHVLRSRAKRSVGLDSTPQWTKRAVHQLNNFKKLLRNRSS
jgi:hypothetical protein